MSSSKGKGGLQETEFKMEGELKKLKSNQQRELINLEKNIRFKKKLDLQRLVLQKLIDSSENTSGIIQNQID